MVTVSLVSFEYIRVNKIDGIDVVEIDEDGIELVEIDEDGMEYVLVNKIDDKKSVQIYGTVVVNDPLRQNIVYHRASVKSERLRLGEYMSLTGPSKSVIGLDPFFIGMNLWVKLWDHDHDTEITKEIAKGLINYNTYTRYGYGSSFQEDVLGKHGSVSLGYSVIQEALFTSINVVMLNESPAQIYGTIKASRFLGKRILYPFKSVNGLLQVNPQKSGLSTTILFDKSANECVEVNPQESIPGTVCSIPVSVDSYLTIEVDLWEHHRLSSDDQIVLGSVQFTPILGTQKRNITSEYGQMQVSITCNYQ